jgi:predicted kinase
MPGMCQIAILFGMQQLSRNYRNDDTNELPSETKDYLDEHYLGKLENLDKTNPKILVVFSGGSGVGKSSLAQHIKQELGAIVLENDEIKTSIKDHQALERGQRNALTWQYSMLLYNRLRELTNNGLVVRDGVIDWYFDRILPIFEAQGYQIFIIGYDISREKREKLIRKRGDKKTIDVDYLLGLMPEQDAHIARFREHHTPDVTLHDDDMFDYEPVIAKLRLMLQASRN